MNETPIPKNINTRNFINNEGMYVPRHLLQPGLIVPKPQISGQDEPSTDEERIYHKLFGVSSSHQRQIEHYDAQESLQRSETLHSEEKHKQNNWNKFSVDPWRNLSLEISLSNEMNQTFEYIRRMNRARKILDLSLEAQETGDTRQLQNMFNQLSSEEKVSFTKRIRTFLTPFNEDYTLIDLLQLQNPEKHTGESYPVPLDFFELTFLLSDSQILTQHQEIQNVIHSSLAFIKEVAPLKNMQAWNNTMEQVSALTDIYCYQHETFTLNAAAVLSDLLETLSEFDEMRNGFGAKSEFTWQTWDVASGLIDIQLCSLTQSETLLSLMEYHEDMDHPLALKLLTLLPEDHPIKIIQYERINKLCLLCEEDIGKLVIRGNLREDVNEYLKGIITFFPDGVKDVSAGVELEVWPEIFGVPLSEDYILGVDGGDKIPEIRKSIHAVSYDGKWLESWTQFERWFQITKGKRYSLHLHTRQAPEEEKIYQLLFLKYLGGLEDSDIRFNSLGTIEWRLPVDDYTEKKGIAFIANSRLIDFFIAAAHSGYKEIQYNELFSTQTSDSFSNIFRLTTDPLTRAAAMRLWWSRTGEKRGLHPRNALKNITLDAILKLPMSSNAGNDFLFDYALKLFPEEDRIDLIGKKYALKSQQVKKDFNIPLYFDSAYFRLLQYLPIEDAEGLISLFPKKVLNSFEGICAMISYIEYFPDRKPWRPYIEQALQNFYQNVNYINLYEDVISQIGLLYEVGEFRDLSEVFNFVVKYYRDDLHRPIEENFLFWRSFSRQIPRLLSSAIEKHELNNPSQFFTDILNISSSSSEKLEGINQSLNQIFALPVWTEFEIDKALKAIVSNSSLKSDEMDTLLYISTSLPENIQKWILKEILERADTLSTTEKYDVKSSLIRYAGKIPIAVTGFASTSDFVFLQLHHCAKAQKGLLLYDKNQVKDVIYRMDEYVELNPESITSFLLRLTNQGDIDEEITDMISAKLATFWFLFQDGNSDYQYFTPEAFSEMIETLEKNRIYIQAQKKDAFPYIIGHYTRNFWHLRNGTPLNIAEQ